jgi:hypothetical protein
MTIFSFIFKTKEYKGAKYKMFCIGSRNTDDVPGLGRKGATQVLVAEPQSTFLFRTRMPVRVLGADTFHRPGRDLEPLWFDDSASASVHGSCSE